MEITVNGQPHIVPEGTTVAALLETLDVKTHYVAVERNLEIVPRAQYAEHVLCGGDQLEVVTLVGGGVRSPES
ncbi:MAG: sulfur carrier protein ThiS [Planctomycetes bacterium]|nr:sulfur carrier protein ThiS [Planctomycetota bacterium]